MAALEPEDESDRPARKKATSIRKKTTEVGARVGAVEMAMLHQTAMLHHKAKAAATGGQMEEMKPCRAAAEESEFVDRVNLKKTSVLSSSSSSFSFSTPSSQLRLFPRQCPWSSRIFTSTSSRSPFGMRKCSWKTSSLVSKPSVILARSQNSVPL
ncbi:uncharacterized protein LOC133707423 [Rosa rugosa]|uniref:uncharacterized protein LOC133707423 n=1 Tax=Rosa rugosa TaxID=74645 RepID=UPI002B40DC82|nr:uncharacterized protein LOC133707423 [Rosa rugosa]